MIRNLLCILFGFLVGSYYAVRNMNTANEFDDEDEDNHVMVTPSDIQDKETVCSIIIDWHEVNKEEFPDSELTFHHPSDIDCWLCTLIDSVDLTIDGVLYEHTIRKKDGQTYHVIKARG